MTEKILAILFGFISNVVAVTGYGQEEDVNRRFKCRKSSALQNQPDNGNDPPNRYVWQVVSGSDFRFFRELRLLMAASAPSDPVGVMAAFGGSSGLSAAEDCFRRR